MPSQFRRKTLYALLFSTATLPVVPALAAGDEADPSITNLPMFTVSESALGIDPNIPANTASISAEVLDRLNMPTSEDALRYLPNLNVRQRYIGDRNAALEVRGMSNIQSARGLVLADGVILSNLLGSDHANSPRWSMVLPEEIERIDVIYGPYSALYSGNAMGAAVIYTTRMPDDFEARAKLLVHQQKFDLNGTDDTYDGHMFNAVVGDRMGRFSYLLGVSNTKTTGQPTGFALLNPGTTPLQGDETEIVSGAYPIVDRRGQERLHIGVSGSGIETNEQDEFKLKLGYDITPNLEGRFTLASWRVDAKTGRPEHTTYLRDADGNRVYSGPVNIDGARYVIGSGTFAPRVSEEEHWMYAGTLRSKNETGWNYELTAALYDMKENIARTASVPSDVAWSTGGPGTANVQDGSGWWHADAKFDRRFGHDDSHWLTFGAHYSSYELEQESRALANWRSGALGARTAANQGSTEIAALFAQDAWQISERWKAVLGLRFEDWKASDGSRTSGADTVAYPNRSDTAWSPKASLEYTPDSIHRYRLSVARSTRFPTVAELFQGSISANQIIGSDPNLKPEEATSVDFTIETLLENGITRISLWAEDSKDTIFRYQEFSTVGGVGSNMYQNVDHVRIRGIEWVYDTWNVLGLTGLDLHANVAFNESEVLEDSGDPRNVGNEFYRIPRVRAAVVATYQQTDKLSYTVGGRYSGRSRASLDNTDVNRHAIDGVGNFTVFDVKMNYDINRYIGLGAGVNNVTDERYYVGHPYAGRTVFADVTLSY